MRKGEVDRAVTTEELGQIIKAITGKDYDFGRLPFGQYGTYNKKTGQVSISRDMDQEFLRRVLAHETGHPIEWAGWQETSGVANFMNVRRSVRQQMIDGMRRDPQVERDLRFIYNDLNNPYLAKMREFHRNPGWSSSAPRYSNHGPEAQLYPADEVLGELIAEGIRAYLTDPNYMKTVAPAAATLLRKAVNDHPLLSQIIQFNSSGSGVITPFLSQTGIRPPVDPGGQD